ncbi:MAG TPA: zinc-finger domain-containing protein [Alphaproteobacteria bacterium]|nr:zinc-finger domain-containing protein [Alphaproteobacteria bacterium]
MTELNATTPQEQLAAADLPPPETLQVTHAEVYCDGAGYGDGGEHHTCANIPAALGHPRVFLVIPPGHNHVDCTYCDRRFVLSEA